MPTLGMGELTIILLIVIVLFGATRLPQLGEGLGKAIRGLRSGLRSGEPDPESSEPPPEALGPGDQSSTADDVARARNRSTAAPGPQG